MKSSVPTRLSSKARKKGEQGGAFMTYLIFFGVCGYLLLVGLTNIYLQRKTDALRADWDVERSKLETIRKERKNLELRREQYMKGSYILPRARRLGLGPPLPGQVRKMPPSDELGRKERTVAERSQ